MDDGSAGPSRYPGGVKQVAPWQEGTRRRPGTFCRNLPGTSETSRHTWCNLRPGEMPGQLLMLVFSAKKHS